MSHASFQMEFSADALKPGAEVASLFKFCNISMYASYFRAVRMGSISMLSKTLLEVDEGEAGQAIILLSLPLQLVKYLKMIDSGISCSESCLFS